MKKKCVIIDIDGVLSQSQDAIDKYIIQDKKDFESFEKRYKSFKVWNWAKIITNQMFNYCSVIILTAREDRNNTREDTEEWLSRKNINYSKLIMRDHKDYRLGEEIKKDKLKKIKKEYDVLFVVDDSPSINKMYKGEGVLCLLPNNTKYVEET